MLESFTSSAESGSRNQVEIQNEPTNDDHTLLETGASFRYIAGPGCLRFKQ